MIFISTQAEVTEEASYWVLEYFIKILFEGNCRWLSSNSIVNPYFTKQNHQQPPEKSGGRIIIHPRLNADPCCHVIYSRQNVCYMKVCTRSAVKHHLSRCESHHINKTYSIRKHELPPRLGQLKVLPLKISSRRNMLDRFPRFVRLITIVIHSTRAICFLFPFKRVSKTVNK